MELADRVALVTGGARGIGRACVLALARAGCHVVVNYLTSEEAARKVCREVEALGRRAVAVRADVAAEQEVERLVRTATDALGPVDALVNNAGVEVPLPAGGSPGAAWDRVLAVNLKGAYLCARAVAPGMKARGQGVIINISSTAGLTAYPEAPHYAASKAGMINLTRTLALAWAPEVRVVGIAPGWTDTAMAAGLSAEEKTIICESIPLGRFARPEEVGRLAAFLAAEADYMTGHTVVLDGGALLQGGEST